MSANALCGSSNLALVPNEEAEVIDVTEADTDDDNLSFTTQDQWASSDEDYASPFTQICVKDTKQNQEKPAAQDSNALANTGQAKPALLSVWAQQQKNKSGKTPKSYLEAALTHVGKINSQVTKVIAP